MKSDARFNDRDTPLLRKILRVIAEPARRHLCPLCKEVFECHLCTQEREHPVHWDNCNTPFLCPDCAQEMGLETVASLGNKGPRWVNIYNYQTGELLSSHPVVRGIGTKGRIRRQAKDDKHNAHLGARRAAE
jgi:hypothetical protein